MARFDLTDTEWAVISPLLPNKPRGVPRTDDRRVLNGIFWTLRTGSPWRDLPERYGPYTTVYNRYNRWAKAGVWLCIFETLAERSPDSLHLEGAPNYTANAEPNWSDRTYGQSVDRYYGY
jgi:transposase